MYLNHHKIELNVEIEENKILDQDFFVTIVDSRMVIIGKTEKKRGEKLAFDTNFKYEYIFEKVQNLKIIVSTDTSSYEFSTNVGKIMSNNNFLSNDHFKLSLKAKIIHNDAKELQSIFSLKYSLKLLSMTKKFITFKLMKYDNIKTLIEGDLLYQSEEQSGQKTFQFCDAIISKELVLDKDNVFTIELYEKNVFIGKTKPVKLKQFKSNTNGFMLYDLNLLKEIPSKLEVKYSEQKSKTFIDYLSTGLQLNCIFAIDFTSSNLDYKIKESLHNIDKEELNAYETVIKDCGTLLESYDNMNMYSVYGFGGIPHEKDEVSHSFNVNLNNEQSTNGLESVLENYRKYLSKIKFLGPTYFKLFLKNIIEKVTKSVSTTESTYFVCLILADGQINDMEDTIDLFVEAAKLPISFIIVGVGDGDFGNMTVLGIFFLIFR